MFGTIRRHQQWLWAVIITLTIVSFVFFFMPGGNNASQSSGPLLSGRSVAGRAVTADEYNVIVREVYLDLLCNYGTIPDEARLRQMGFDLQQQADIRLALTEQAKELGLHAGDEPAQRMAAMIVTAFSRQGVTSYSAFVSGVLAQFKFTEAEFQQYLRHQLIIREFRALSGLAANLITPQEAQDDYLRENEGIEAQVVVFHATNFLANVKITPEALGTFYTNQLAAYRIGERAVLEYVRFPATNFYAEADKEMAKFTNLTASIDQEYLKRGTNAFPDAKTPEEAKAKIRQELRDEIAVVSARRAANQFALAIFADETNRLGRLRSLATATNLVVQTTEPFVVTDSPKEFIVPENFESVLAALTPESPVPSSPVVTRDAVYVYGLARRIPSENPPFDSVKARVTEDFKEREALLAAQKAGLDASTAIEAATKAGKSFADACLAAKVTPIKLPAFTLTSRSEPEIEKQVSLGMLQNVVFTMAAGDTSPLRPTADGGFIVHVAQRMPAKLDKMQAELPQVMAQLRQSRQNEILGTWYRRLQETGYLQLPRTQEPELRSGSSPTNAPRS